MNAVIRLVQCFPLMLFGTLFGTLICAALSGCGNTGPYVPVSGTVKFEDGTVPQGDISSISFQSKSGGPDTKGAQGTIEPDGSFQLHSERRGDGAKPGEYAVTVQVMVGYPNGKSVVPLEYTDSRETPLFAEVRAKGKNRFEFTVQKTTGTTENP